MQNNFYFLKKLTSRIKYVLPGKVLAESYSQNKDELILGFSTSEGHSDFFIRAMLRPDFCCLSFPEELHRARKNSVNLFDELLNKEVKEVVQFNNERAFLLKFNEGYSLLFKMHGNRSNIVLVQNEQPVGLFNSRLQKDLEIDVSALDRPIDQSYDAFIQANGDYKKLFPTFGKEIQAIIESKGYENFNLLEQWQIIQEILAELKKDEFFILKDDLPAFSLIPYLEIEKEYHDPIEALSDFYIRWLSAKRFSAKSQSAKKQLVNEIKKDRAYIKNTKQKLEDLEKGLNYRQMADVLMANLHNVKQGEKTAILDNFYDQDRQIEIPLNVQLSPQKNAERYYQKAKNQHKELENLLEGLIRREEDLKEKELLLEKIESTEDYKELVDLLPEERKKEEPVNLPYHYFNIEGFDVYVGKSARHNDILLQRYSKKDDLWLHARSVSGSHVIIRAKGDATFPVNVIEKAAQLAAYNSKAKTESLCPVIYTPRKYVRKRKGDPPGAVVVDKEEVILVEPRLEH